MFFLRITLFMILVLGFLIYFIATRIRAEFFNHSGQVQPLFGGHSEEFEAFCSNPPRPSVSRLSELKRKLSVALSIAIIAFLLSILSVAL